MIPVVNPDVFATTSTLQNPPWVDPRAVVEGAHGLFHGFANTLDGDYGALIGDFGTRWVTQTLAFKPYPCGTMTHPYIDCARRLGQRIKADDVVELVGPATITLDSAMLAQGGLTGPDLLLQVRTSTGDDVVDASGATGNGVWVTGVPGSAGAAAWDQGQLTTAPTARVAVVLDVNFLATGAGGTLDFEIANPLNPTQNRAFVQNLVTFLEYLDCCDNPLREPFAPHAPRAAASPNSCLSSM